jgi:predicted ester cyclase
MIRKEQVVDTEANKRTVRRVFEEAFTQGDLDVVDACLAPEAVDRHPFADDEPDFRAHLKGNIRMLRAALPDLVASVEDLVAEGDRVAARVHLTGTHTGAPLFGVAPTGSQVAVEQFHIVQCDEGARGIRHWAYVGVDQLAAQVAATAAI